MPYVANASLQDLARVAPVETASRRMAVSGRDMLHDRAQDRTPVSKPLPGHSPAQALADRNFRKPGTMKAAWESEPVVKYEADGVTRFGATVHNPDPQAPHVEWDTKPHVIRPRLDRQMADGTSNASNAETRKPRGLRQLGTARLRVPVPGGGYAFPKEVNHPGTQGKHMLRDALQDVEASWSRTLGLDELELWAREQLRGVA